MTTSPADITCDGCGAKPDTPCLTRRGANAHRYHKARIVDAHYADLIADARQAAPGTLASAAYAQAARRMETGVWPLAAYLEGARFGAEWQTTHQETTT